MSESDSLLKIYSPDDQKDHFDPELYLKQYYGDNNLNKGLKIILYFLPNIAARLQLAPGRPEFGGKTILLDIGSGPAIYMALGLRHKVDKIILSDYAAQNRRQLELWWKRPKNGDCKNHVTKELCFDWTPITKAIAELEGRGLEWYKINEEARSKVCNVAFCDVHDPTVLKMTNPISKQLLVPSDEKCLLPDCTLLNDYRDFTAKFDVISCIFCLEYASTSFEQYSAAMSNVCNLIRPGGYLILGGAFEESFYTIGEKKFACFYLTESFLFEALKNAGISVDDTKTFAFYLHENAFVVVGVKQ